MFKTSEIFGSGFDFFGYVILISIIQYETFITFYITLIFILS